MGQFQQELRDASFLAWAFLDLVLAWIAYAAQWLRGVLAEAGLPPMLQTALLACVAVLLGVGVLRAMGGLLRLLILVAAGLLIARAAGAI